MALKTLVVATFAALTLTSSASAQIIVDNLNVRTAGPIATDVSITSGAVDLGTSHANIPSWTVNFTVSNQDLDGVGGANDSFTFDLTATTTSENGISIWGQGLNNSNGPGTNTSFSNVDGITFSVSNIGGMTSEGEFIVFDGFTAAGLGAFDFSGDLNPNQGALINGTQVDASFPGTTGGTAELDLSGTLPATVLFNNSDPTSGDAKGTRLVRTLDLQFSSTEEDPGIPGDADGDMDVDGTDFLVLQRDDPAGISEWQGAYPAPLSAATAVPEPSTLVMLGVGSLGLLRRRVGR